MCDVVPGGNAWRNAWEKRREKRMVLDGGAVVKAFAREDAFLGRISPICSCPSAIARVRLWGVFCFMHLLKAFGHESCRWLVQELACVGVALVLTKLIAWVIVLMGVISNAVQMKRKVQNCVCTILVQ